MLLISTSVCCGRVVEAQSPFIACTILYSFTMSARSLRAVCQRSSATLSILPAASRINLSRRAAHSVSSSSLLSSHRCSLLCLVHRPLSSSSALTSSPSSSFASLSTSRNPLPASSTEHTRSSSISDDSFHPADPEVEGFKTRLLVERRVHSAITSLPKLADNPTLTAARPPADDVQIDWWPLGHDDPLAVVRLDSLDIDSLDKVELLTAVEKEFGIEFTDEQYEQFATVGDIIENLLWNPNTK